MPAVFEYFPAPGAQAGVGKIFGEAVPGCMVQAAQVPVHKPCLLWKLYVVRLSGRAVFITAAGMEANDSSNGFPASELHNWLAVVTLQKNHPGFFQGERVHRIAH